MILLLYGTVIFVLVLLVSHIVFILNQHSFAFVLVVSSDENAIKMQPEKFSLLPLLCCL